MRIEWRVPLCVHMRDGEVFLNVGESTQYIRVFTGESQMFFCVQVSLPFARNWKVSTENVLVKQWSKSTQSKKRIVRSHWWRFRKSMYVCGPDDPYYILYFVFQLSDTGDKNLKLALAASPSDKRANVIYSDTLTMLFEGIARVVEIHQPLVETYYGKSKS